MRGYTVAVIAGTLVKDIELRKTTTGKDVASFTMAVNHKDKTASFIDCVAWEKAAETLSKHLSKGDGLLVQGELKQRTWEHEGTKRTKMEVIVTGFSFLPNGKDGNVEQPRDVVVEDIDDRPIDLSGIPF